MGNINLFLSVYIDKVPERNKELKECLIRNSQAGFSTIILILEPKSEEEISILLNSAISITTPDNIIVLKERANFNYFFKLMSDPKFSDSINVMCNSDIYFNYESLNSIRKFYDEIPNKKNTCLALSRWDIYPDGSASLFDRADSQDTWVFYGNPKVSASINFPTGRGGCDNRIAYEIEQCGYTIINPSKSIKTYHLHLCNVRNYINDAGQVIDIVPPPYKLIQPT